MKMKAREIGNVGQLCAIQRMIQMSIDVVEHAVHAPRVLGERCLGARFGGHSAWNPKPSLFCQ
jgi:hypothetical protein